jgi:hypothetical protein
VVMLLTRQYVELHCTSYEEGQRAMKLASKIIYTPHTSCSYMTCSHSKCASNACMWLRHKLSELAQYCQNSILSWSCSDVGAAQLKRSSHFGTSRHGCSKANPPIAGHCYAQSTANSQIRSCITWIIHSKVSNNQQRSRSKGEK